MMDAEITDERLPRGDEVSMIVEAIRRKFGTDAYSVAGVQVEEAVDSQTRVLWEAILDRISGG